MGGRVFWAAVLDKLYFSNIKPGTVLFGKFRVERCLSAGQVGGVYLCANLAAGDKPAALKVLATEAEKNADLAAAFRRELELSCRVAHPNVAAGSDFYQDEEFTAFAMEYVGGGTLADAMERKKFTAKESLKLLFQLAAGLQALHSRGIIHRDLKPENALINAEGLVKIADFGIASYQGAEDPEMRDRIVGTMDYLSPEYIAHGAYDHRADIYALGVIGYELITGKLPYSGGSILDSLMRRVQTDPPAPNELAADCSPELGALIMKAIKRSPDERYQYTAELLRDIGRLIPGERTPNIDAGTAKKAGTDAAA